MKTHFADDETLAELERLQKENQRLIMALADTEALELGTSERCEKLREELATVNLANEIERATRVKLEALLHKQAEQITAANLRIEQIREALKEALENYIPDSQAAYFEDAMLAQPSTEALAERDRKRDAALLRFLAEKTYKRKHALEIEDIAKKRESGEWEPELEVK